MDAPTESAADTAANTATVAAHGSASPAGEAWTTRRLLKWMTDHFAARGVDSPRVIGEMLLSHVLTCERMRLYMEVDRVASDAERELLRDLVRRASKHEPVQYLIGESWFFTRPFGVNPSTLIPRPSTETLVEYVLQWCRPQPEAFEPAQYEVVEVEAPAEHEAESVDDTEPTETSDDHPMIEDAPIETDPIRIADIGTGTGCIAISLVAQLPQASAIATDISADALTLAAENAERHGLTERIEFRHGDGLAPLADEPAFDILCSNPPYIPDHEWDEVAANVRDYEPESALRAGADGLDVIRPLIENAAGVVRSGGLIAVEIAACQRDAVIELARSTGDWDKIRVVKDLEGHERVLLATRR